MVKNRLTSPGQTINRKLFNRLVISGSDSGFTPLICTSDREMYQKSSAVIKQNNMTKLLFLLKIQFSGNGAYMYT